ncbi:MAG: NTP transferase domain-containing protein [Chloroflexota bacterium]|nr:NTP transferase domain-containing protein [Chloroflexota bacterium]
MLDIVILAAGMGTRMKSELPKVLHPVAGRPMIVEVLETAHEMEANRCVVVVGYGAEQVQEVVGGDVNLVLQAEQLGTGHAVMQARETLEESGADTVLVLYGDTPLITAATLRRAAVYHRERGATITLLSFLPEDPAGYGRIVRDEAGAVRAIVEHKDATEAQHAIQESNSGTLFCEAAWLWENLDKLTLSPQGEYYLTDLSALAVSQGRVVEAVTVDEQEVMGINNRVQLAEASRILWERRRHHWMMAGVTLVDPGTVWIDADVAIGRDTVVHPNVVLRGKTIIGERCKIGPHSVLENVVLGNVCDVTQSQIVDSELAAGRSVGPFAVLHGETVESPI